MYSILCLGIVMTLEGFKVEVPEFVSPVVTFIVIAMFFWKSVRHARKLEAEGKQYKIKRYSLNKRTLGKRVQFI